MNIKEIRIKRNLTQRYMAHAIGITEQQYRNIENNKNQPLIRTGLLIAKILDIDPYKLYNID